MTTTPLTKAILLRLLQVPKSGKKGKASFQPDPKGAFEVQLNPTSLKISRTNNIDKGAATTNTQKRQTPSVQPATLAFDLEFDSAEGDGSGRPVDVRTLTQVVRQFAEPSKESPDKPPPAVRLVWGTFSFTGIVTSLTEDLDYFSPDGRPLRAKVSVTITEQNPDWEAGLVGPAAKTAKTATAPGGAAGGGGAAGPGGATAPARPGGTGPGAAPTRSPVSTALAQAGQSIQQLLARMNADPATWRAAMAGLDSPLNLAAGAQVQLGANVSASAGLGAGAGFAAGVGASAPVGGGARAEASAGFALAEAGGVAAAASAVAVAETTGARAQARASFDVPAVRATAGAGVTTPDPRALTYGRGVPLSRRIGR